LSALQAGLLGIVQGVTEFLPISSSAHLILVRDLLGWRLDDDFALAFDVACHVGTLAAVAAYFRSDVRALARAALRRSTWSEAGDRDARLLRSLAVATLPVVVVGLAAGDWIAGAVRTPEVAAASLAAGAVAMLAAERSGRGRGPGPGHPRGSASGSGSGEDAALGWVPSLGLGSAQAAALVPGVSRSGAVLTVAMLVGLRRDRAARFAFLLGIPAIAGAGAKGTIDLAAGSMPPEGLAALGIGAVASGLVGYVAIFGFLRYVARHTLDPFAAYRIGLAAAVLLAR
jgi:undecaprenyl-diphosphatase